MKEGLKTWVLHNSSFFKTLVWKESAFEWVVIIVFRSVVLASITCYAIFSWCPFCPWLKIFQERFSCCLLDDFYSLHSFIK